MNYGHLLIFSLSVVGSFFDHYNEEVARRGNISALAEGDDEIAKIVINVIEILKEELMKGIPAMNIPPVDPLPIDSLALDLSGMAIELNEAILTGLLNFNVTRMLIDTTGGIKVDYELTFHDANIVANYHLNGSLGEQHIFGDGAIMLRVKTLKLIGYISTTSHCDMFILERFELKPNLKILNSANVFLTGFMHDQKLSDAAALALQIGLPGIINGIGDIGSSVKDLLNKVLVFIQY